MIPIGHLTATDFALLDNTVHTADHRPLTWHRDHCSVCQTAYHAYLANKPKALDEYPIPPCVETVTVGMGNLAIHLTIRYYPHAQEWTCSCPSLDVWASGDTVEQAINEFCISVVQNASNPINSEQRYNQPGSPWYQRSRNVRKIWAQDIVEELEKIKSTNRQRFEQMLVMTC